MPDTADMLTLREGAEVDAEGRPAGITAENIILTGDDVRSAEVRVFPNGFGGSEFWVELTLYESGRQAFAEATYRLIGEKISIWVGGEMISDPVVHAHITDGVAIVSGGFDLESAVHLAYMISGEPPQIPQGAGGRTATFHTLDAGVLRAALLTLLIYFAF